MTKYNKSNIMKKAWTIYKGVKASVGVNRTFGSCLKQAWGYAKEEAEKNERLKELEDGSYLERAISGVILRIRKEIVAGSGRVGYVVYGKSYPVKDKLKKAGFRFDWESKQWYTESIESASIFA